MKLSKPNIPKELDADVAMSVILPHANSISGKELSYNYEFKGVSERTALGDDLSIPVKMPSQLSAPRDLPQETSPTSTSEWYSSTAAERVSLRIAPSSIQTPRA